MGDGRISANARPMTATVCGSASSGRAAVDDGARDPTEVGGDYFRILPEGTLEDYDGFMLKIKKRKKDLI